MPLGNQYSPIPLDGNAGDVLTKDSAAPNACSWQPAGTGTGDVTKDAIASGTTITSIADTDVLAVVTPGTPNVLRKIAYSAFKTLMNGLYALTGHNHDSSYVAKNAAITGATKTKITYDAKGLVTSGSDATQDDIGDGTTNKQYSATDKSKLAGIEASADVTDIGNVSTVIGGASAATPVDADKFPFYDDTDSTLKTVTGANLKTYIGASGSTPEIGEIRFFSSASTNPATIWAGTTWSRLDGGFLGLYKSGDANFGTANAAVSGGAATKNLRHTHDQGTLATADHVVSSLPNQGGTANGTVMSKTHSITGSTGNGLSTTQDVLNPGWVVCGWVRTA